MTPEQFTAAINQIGWTLRGTAERLELQAARDAYAREFCNNQAAMANMSQHGLVNAAFAGLTMQASCLDFYQRTGHLPGQGF